MAVVVFRGEPASADVIAGFLRTARVPFVEVVPPSTPYPAGPLRQAIVRVPDEHATARRLLDEMHLENRLDYEFPVWMRLVAAFLLTLYVGGAVA
ncbi:MAG: hypothetical protein ACRDJP_12390 [Actinomycetota bacterium]